MTLMTDQITIAKRFCGPPDSGNGGYSAGLLGKRFEGAAQITLKKPIPIERPLGVRAEGEGLALTDGDAPVMIARPDTLDLDIPMAPGLDAARVGRLRGTVAAETSPFRTCFVCGLDRAEGDGMGLIAGPVAHAHTCGHRLVAAPWTVGADLTEADGRAGAEFIWAALDCPGFFGAAASEPDLKALLGRITARIWRRPAARETCMVAGWPISADGRKRLTGTAVYDAEGAVLAAAKAVWITI